MVLGYGDFNDTQQKILQTYIQDNLPKETVFTDQIKRNVNVEQFNGSFYAPLRTGRNTGVVGLANDKSKLRTGNSTFDQAQIDVKFITGTFDISDFAIKASANKKYGVAAQLVRQGVDLKNDFAKNLNRMGFRDGVGAVAQVAGSVGVGTISVQLPNASLDDGRSIDNYGTINGDINPVKYLSVGQAIGIGTGAADAGTITAINGNTLVVTGSPAIVADDTIYYVDGDEAGAGTSEIQGFRAAINSTSGTSQYATVPRSVQGWTAQLDATAEALSLSRMEDLYLSAREFAQPGDRLAWFMNRTPFKKYGNILTAMRQTVNQTDLLGGWSGLEFQIGANGKGSKVGVFLDYDVPDGVICLVNLDSWTVCEVAPMEWIDGGNQLRRSDYTTFQKVMGWYVNYLCVCPAANAIGLRKTG